jgi:hypothetical protein
VWGVVEFDSPNQFASLRRDKDFVVDFPKEGEEKRGVDGVLARKKGIGL